MLSGFSLLVYSFMAGAVLLYMTNGLPSIRTTKAIILLIFFFVTGKFLLSSLLDIGKAKGMASGIAAALEFLALRFIPLLHLLIYREQGQSEWVS